MQTLFKTWNSLRKILVTLIFITGVSVFVFGLLNIRKAAAYKKYPSVNGFVIDSAAAKSEETEGKSLYVVNIVYEYSIDGTQFYSTTISSMGYDLFGESKAYYTGTLESMKNVLDKYPVGADVTVFHNPQNPQDSIIDQDLKIPAFLPLILGSIFLLVSLHLCFFSGIFRANMK